MRQRFEINNKAQNFLNYHFNEIMQKTLYIHCTPKDEPENFLYFLLEHLVETARILEKWECEEYLWRAGGFHSIYGTEAFTTIVVPFSPFPLQSREEIRTLIGSKAEHLAYLFCALTKESLFSNLDKEAKFTIFDRFDKVAISISENDYLDLLVLTLADWIEPVTGKENNPHPKTTEHIRAFHREAFIKATRLLPEKAVKDFQLAYGIK